MKKIYLLLMALLVSCLYTPHAKADEVTVTLSDIITSKPTAGTTVESTSAPKVSLNFPKGAKTYATGRVTLDPTSPTVNISIESGYHITGITFNGFKKTRANTKVNATPGTLTSSTSAATWAPAASDSDVSSIEVKISGTGSITYSFTGLTITYEGGGGGEEPTPTLALDNTYPYKATK